MRRAEARARFLKRTLRRKASEACCANPILSGKIEILTFLAKESLLPRRRHLQHAGREHDFQKMASEESQRHARGIDSRPAGHETMITVARIALRRVGIAS